MKIVLSRKGFDSSTGGVPSPILPDGRLIPLPIPDRNSNVRYGQIEYGDVEIGKLVHSLTRGRIRSSSRVHLDPDLVSIKKYSRDGLRACFGQCGSAASHLLNQGVGKGDLFLFFGWFREVWGNPRHSHSHRFSYKPGAPDLHVIFGWLLIDQVICPSGPIPGSIRDHPHCTGPRPTPNRLYLASNNEGLSLGGKEIPSAGMLPFARRPQILTANGSRRSLWNLPSWCFPREGNIPFSYHSDLRRWKRVGQEVRLSSVARGQEFVLDTKLFPEARDWSSGVLEVDDW